MKSRMMSLGVLLSLGFAVTMQVNAEWKPAPGMKTEWGEKVTPENAWREYPRPQMVRENWTNLNGLWQYSVTNAPGIPKTWQGEILVPFVIESPLSGVKRLLEKWETLWYRRTFTANVKPGERLLLHFEQADFRAQVYVNGVEAGVPHEGGQMPFSFDITDFVKNGENELAVAIWDPTTDFIGSTGKQELKPKYCFYVRSSGIGGTVWLETIPETHLTDYKVATDIDVGMVSVTLEGAGNLMGIKGEINVLKDGKKIASGSLKAWGKPVTIKLPQPIALWSPESPALYDLAITLEDKSVGVKDFVKGYFGMRKIEVKKDAKGVLRFFFNNQPRFILATLDQGWWPDGLLTPPSAEAMAFDIVKLKEMGYDAIRKHIKVEPRRYYHQCDKLGILVLQDMPSSKAFCSDDFANKAYGFYRRELKDMMDCLQKVPSIVMWVPYNENWGQPGQHLTHATLMWTQRYDPMRIVNGPSGWNDFEGGKTYNRNDYKWTETKHLPAGEEEAAHTIDLHDYDPVPKMFPVNDRRASFLGEFGGMAYSVKGHTWEDEATGYGGKPSKCVENKDVAQKRLVDMMKHVGNMAQQGLAGCVYTQTTDVGFEISGLITYDRKVVKFDPAVLSAVHDEVRKMANRGNSR